MKTQIAARYLSKTNAPNHHTVYETTTGGVIAGCTCSGFYYHGYCWHTTEQREERIEKLEQRLKYARRESRRNRPDPKKRKKDGRSKDPNPSARSRVRVSRKMS